jgi:hypothetical protein
MEISAKQQKILAVILERGAASSSDVHAALASGAADGQRDSIGVSLCAAVVS